MKTRHLWRRSPDVICTFGQSPYYQGIMVLHCYRSLVYSVRLFLFITLESMIYGDLATINFLKESDGPIPNALNARDFGVVGDGVTDDSLTIQRFIDKAWLDQKIAFFPSGEYVISENIWINGAITIEGSFQGMTVFTAQRTKILQKYIGNKKQGLKGLTVSHIFFDGIMLYFNSKQYKYNFRLSNCLFFTSRVPQLPISKHATIDWQRVANGIINNVLILRSKVTHGVGISFYKTKHVRVENNIVGLDFNSLCWLASQYQGINTWDRLIEKLNFIKAYYKINSDQGHFISAMYGNRDDSLTIKGNIFNGSPYKPGFLDHVIYLKGFDGLYVLGNYARGWPNSPWGGLKMRNGENLVVARNYLVDTGILLYTHNETTIDPLHQGLSNVYIYANHFVELTNIGSWATGILYFEPHWIGNDTNINFCHNIFEIPNLNLKSPPIGIRVSNGNIDEHHVFKDNVYFGTTVPVKLVCYTEIEYEDGTCDPKMVSQYNNIRIPNLIIPPYRNQTALGNACNISAF